ncbi:MAG: ribosomal protein S9 [Paracoccaceae bacterium]
MANAIINLTTAIQTLVAVYAALIKNARQKGDKDYGDGSDRAQYQGDLPDFHR